MATNFTKKKVTITSLMIKETSTPMNSLGKRKSNMNIITCLNPTMNSWKYKDLKKQNNMLNYITGMLTKRKNPTKHTSWSLQGKKMFKRKKN